MTKNKPCLYIVATPIGNLSDITYRAIEILNSVSLIAAEDTRTTSILLNQYNISTKLTSYHKFSENEKKDLLINKIKSGESIALVSDAGTPLISDPGNILVKEAINQNIKVIPVGGISAVTTFLSSISREDEDFKFIGFLPKIKDKIETILKENKKENLIFYESPNRIKDTFKIIASINPDCMISIGRELTKKFEETKTAPVNSLIEYYNSNPLKGEIVCMVHKTKLTNDDIIKEKTEQLKKQGYTLKDTVSILNITDKANKNKVKEFYLANN